MILVLECSHIDADDVSSPQLAVRWDPVDHLVVDRDARTGRKAPIPLERGDRPLGADVGFDLRVQLAGCQSLPNHVLRQPQCPTDDPGALEIVEPFHGLSPRRELASHQRSHYHFPQANLRRPYRLRERREQGRTLRPGRTSAGGHCGSVERREFDQAPLVKTSKQILAGSAAQLPVGAAPAKLTANQRGQLMARCSAMVEHHSADPGDEGTARQRGAIAYPDQRYP